MPGVIDDLATSKAAGMLANDGAVLPDDDAIRISLNLDRPSNSLGGDRVLARSRFASLPESMQLDESKMPR